MSDDPRPDGPTSDTGRFGATGTPEERRESKALMQALAERKDALGATAQLPAEDRALSERILGEARRRSEQISASSNPAASTQTTRATERVPWWLWLAWLVAIIGSVIAFRYLL